MQSHLNKSIITDELFRWNLSIIRPTAVNCELHSRLLMDRTYLKFFECLVIVLVFCRSHIYDFPLERLSDRLEGSKGDLEVNVVEERGGVVDD